MALFLITMKNSGVVNGVRLEKGMNVEVISTSSNPVTTNNGREVQDAFLRKYNVDLKKANRLAMQFLDVKKIS